MCGAPRRCTIRPMKRGIVLAAAVLVSCSGTASEPPASAPGPAETTRLPACLVLSVGAEAGLSHVGVIQAVKEKGVRVDCVVGTSMGAMVGGLFAARPNSDVADAYRAVAARYREKSEAEAGTSVLLGGVIVGLVVAASGGSTAPVLLGAASGGAAGASSVSPKDWRRLRAVLREQHAGVTIESLPIRFGTVHQELTDSGAVTVAERGGLLADAIATSIANPLLFSDLSATRGRKIDPGLDRVSAIPVEAACEMFPGHQLLVSNVIGGEIFTSRAMNCPYQEIKVPPVIVDATAAMSAMDPAFGQLVTAGYQAAVESVDWNLLPDATFPAGTSGPVQPPVWTVRVGLAIDMATQKPSGNAWDAFGGLPDIEQTTTISACAGCDGFGTSASQPGLRGMVRDTFRAGWDLGVLRLREGMVFDVHVEDADVSSDDAVGDFRLVFEGPGTVATAQNVAARVTLTFSGDVHGQR